MEFSLILAAELVCDAELIKCIPLKILTCMNWEERRRHQRDSMIQRDYRSLSQVNVLNKIYLWNISGLFSPSTFLTGQQSMFAKLVVCWARAWPRIKRMETNVSPTPSLGNIEASGQVMICLPLFSTDFTDGLNRSFTVGSGKARFGFSSSFRTFVHDYQSGCIVLQSKYHFWHAMRLFNKR